ncbi:MAG TPA: nicotinate phosphoribosyltransferase, partial [Kofleriaceae bacterium]|nr:nicotinate phosphoribosyltransferase [Kofleriaceae bacterium]
DAPLFAPAFLDQLAGWRFRADVDAMPEGTLAFAHEPMLRVTGPVLDCQLIETALLSAINFQTLVATKASRLCWAAAGEPVVEFGLRRAQGFDGGMSASRAAYVGGCAGTSNLLAGKLFGIPVRGTHAHSWVMFFDGELEAFRAYADAMPNNCVFLVDTYDTLRGVDHAIEVGAELRARGHRLAGIRLDSGDLAWLSIEARRKLDAAGFADAAIVASNDLDEHLIASLKAQGAAIGVWGVGTRLVTGHDQPALGGVYKLTAVRRADGAWHPTIKLSEQPAKTTIPGLQQVRRLRRGGELIGDVIYDLEAGAGARVADPAEPEVTRPLPEHDDARDLLVPALREGRRVAPPPPLADARARAAAELAALGPRTRRFANPQTYPVALDAGLAATRRDLIARARGDQS